MRSSTSHLSTPKQYDYLDAKRLPSKDNCDVYVETISEVAFLEKDGIISSAPSSKFGLRRGSSPWNYLFGMIGFIAVFVVELQHLFMG